MKKTLLIAAAALAAGIISTQASSVYSQNVVGYANQALLGGLNMVLPAVSASGTNTSSAEAVFPCLKTGDQLYLFRSDGSGFDIAYFNATNDWYDPNNGYASIPVPQLTMGHALYYDNESGSIETNTYTGSVIFSNTVPLLGGLTLVGSSPAIGGSIESTNVGLPFQTGDQVYLWKPDASGFNVAYYNAPGDWYDPNNGYASIPVPQITVGVGFYYDNESGHSTNWVQNMAIPQ